MKFSEKKTQTLLALYENKFDGKFHDLSLLLRNFGIQSSYHELYQIGKALEQEGFINLAASGDSINAFITGSGVAFIEEYDFFDNENNESSQGFSAEDILIVNSKLDELLEKFKSIELGQQVTYNDVIYEFEDLKVLAKKLNKKNWFEVFQGKLIAIGLGKLTDKAFELLETVFSKQSLID